MLKLFTPDRNLIPWIKRFSIALISGALGLELFNLAVKRFGGGPIPGLEVLFWIGRVALIIHGIEGTIAAAYAQTRQQSSLSYGFYTFFVGTVGLVELWQSPNATRDET